MSIEVMAVNADLANTAQGTDRDVEAAAEPVQFCRDGGVLSYWRLVFHGNLARITACVRVPNLLQTLIKREPIRLNGGGAQEEMLFADI